MSMNIGPLAADDARMRAADRLAYGHLGDRDETSVAGCTADMTRAGAPCDPIGPWPMTWCIPGRLFLVRRWLWCLRRLRLRVSLRRYMSRQCGV